MRHKAVYTTGEAARICRLSQQTIIRCFDDGKVLGFRVPGSKFRRIPHDSLIRFMKENKIPLDEMEDMRIRVLVVDDEKPITDLFMEALGSDGRFEVVTAATGYQAGLMTQQFNPDILILDYMLPDLNGGEVCKTIRANPDLEHIKILVISGMLAPSEVDHILKAGADDFMKKPFNLDTVIERIIRLVRA